MTQHINYGRRMHRALQGLMADVLTHVADEGLPGEHHFYITYDTRHPDVTMPDWLRERYPEDITIVIQHWFEDLEVRQDGFGITLNFGDAPVHLFVPMDAVQTFVDPSVEFGLRFDSYDTGEDQAEGEGDATVTPLTPEGDGDDDDTPPPSGAADVVQLDKFRK